MDLPELVADHLDGESPLAGVALGGEDVVVVTPTRTLLYRSEGLLSDESVEAFPHDAERLELNSGRRKTTFGLEYVDGARDFTVPASKADAVLLPLLTGVLRVADVIEADESLHAAERFDALTLVVTDRRLLKHVGGAVWDPEYDDAPFADLTGLEFEEGSVATEMAVEVDGYPHRFKVPNDRAGSVRRTLQEAVFEFYGVSSLEELESLVGDVDEAGAASEDVLERSGFTRLLDGDEANDSGDSAGSAVSAGTGTGSESGDAGRLEALGDETRETGTDADATGPAGPAGTVDAGRDPDANHARDPDAVGERTGTGTDSPDDATVTERLEDLSARLDRQADLLERQQETIQQLVEELRRGR